jgi:Domain of unknown function (DUF1707)
MANLPANSDRPPGTGEVRASDVDRERTADVLRQAAGDGRLTMEELEQRITAVYSAKTYAELEPLIRDLPAPNRAPQPPAATAAGPLPRLRPSRFAISIMGGFHRGDNWAVARGLTAIAVMGGGKIDLRDAQFTDGRASITAFAMMGGIEIIAPEDAYIDVRGMGIMGGVSHAARGAGRTGGPIVVVRALALMGGVKVSRSARRPDGSALPGPGDPGQLTQSASDTEAGPQPG